MATVASTDKKTITKIIQTKVSEDAGERDPSTHVDKPTCFGIPGSGLPRRHCNTNFNVTTAVTSDLTVYVSLNGGNVKQNVFGRNYTCRMYAHPQYFELYIPRGAAGWNDVRFIGADGKEITDDKTKPVLLTEGEVQKTYDKSVPFSWEFNPEYFQMSEKQEYYQNDIIQSMEYEVKQNGGFSKSNSQFSDMGSLKDEIWKQETSSSLNGELWLCGGILYKNSRVTSDITAIATKIDIEGLKLASYYYPGDIQLGNERWSLNRQDGYFRIYNPSAGSAEYLDEEGGWRDVKNTENDRAVEEGQLENWGFRLVGDKWVRLIITGKGGIPEGEDINGDEGIGSDGGGGCCCGMNSGA